MSLPPDPEWTDTPREAMRDNARPKILSLTPDVCKTPIGNSTPSIPYCVVGYPDEAADNYTSSVFFTGQKAMVLRSNTTCCHGDEPGTARGVKSGTVGDICEPLDHSATVRAEGSCLIRDGDKCYMNAKNTIGRCYWTEDTETYGDTYPQLVQVAQATMTSPSGAQVMSDAPAGRGFGYQPNGESAAQWGSRQAGKILRRPGLAGILQNLAIPLNGLERYKDMIDHAPVVDAQGNVFDPDQAKKDIMGQLGVSSDAELDDLIKKAQILEKARTKAKDSVRVSADGTTITICFNKPAKADKEEFDKQLKEQEDELNDMSPDDYLNNRANFEKNGRGADDSSARQKEREKYFIDRSEELETQYISGGMDPEIAQNQAQIDTLDEMASLDALHALDIIAGGTADRIIRLGSSIVNRSLGAGWRGPRVKELDKYAKQAQKRGQTKMKVRLVEC